MEVLTIIVTILLVLCGLAVILAVLFQSGKSAGLSGTIGGVADTFMAKGKAKTFDAKLAKGHQVDRRSVHHPHPDPEHPALI